MSAGPKRHRITIQRLDVSGADDYGTPIKAWVDDAEIWASVEPLRGNEYFRDGDLPQRIAEVDTRMRLRPRPGLNPATNRVVYNGIVYDILSILPDNWGRETQLMVKASDVNGGKVNG